MERTLYIPNFVGNLPTAWVHAADIPPGTLSAFIAVANELRQLVDHVAPLSPLGESSVHVEFARRCLARANKTSTQKILAGRRSA
jgi:hypothetical protein